MKTKLFIALALVMGLAVGSAEAQVSSKRNHKDRIHHGMRNGELNRFERGKLMKEQRRIQRLEHHYRMNDGRISPRERRILQNEKRKQGKKIYRYKHNRHDRF
jgi:hypothetical protein